MTVKLAHKLTGLFLIMAVLVLLTGTIGMVSLSNVSRTTEDILVTRSAQMKQAILMKTTLQECRVHLFEAATAGNDPDEFATAREEFDMKFERLKGYRDILLKGNRKLGIPPAPPGSQVESRLKELDPALAAYTATASSLLSYKERLLGTPRRPTMDETLLSMVKTDIWEQTDKLTVVVDDLIMLMTEQMNAATSDVREVKRQSDLTFMTVIVSAIGVAFLLGFLMTRYLTRRISLIGQTIMEGADGNLGVRTPVDSSDELGDLSRNFNSMLQRLSGMVDQIRSSLKSLIDITAVMHSAINKSHYAADLQASGINATSSSIIEISASINEVATAMDQLTLSASESSSATLELVNSIVSASELIEHLGVMVEGVSASITEMNASIHEIDERISRVAQSTVATAESVASLDTAINRIKSTSSETAAITLAAYADAEQGKQSVETAIEGMKTIREASTRTSRVMDSLFEKTRQIDQIIGVIDEIAEQTNLLALNAAIIAAQAGEQGKGFSVVASEIKDLADRTRNSTQEISDVIKGVQRETAEAVASLKAAVESIVEGERLSRLSGEALDKIVSGVEKASSLMKDVLSSTEEQAQESRTIRNEMTHITDMISQIARATNEHGISGTLISTAAEEMKTLNNKVRIAALEQKRTGEGIARETETILRMIQQINRATTEQSRGSSQIVNGISEIQNSTAVNLESIRMLEESMKRLSDQVDRLAAEVNRFSTAG